LLGFVQGNSLFERVKGDASMPLYEYKCNKCGAKFELRRNISDDDVDVKCPKCGAEKPQRIVSVFGSGLGSDSGGGCSPQAST